jgi:ferredoxin
MGLLPGGTKPAIHQIAAAVDNLCRALVEINLSVRFDLAVMDGILALEGGGSGQGRPKPAQVILASRDLVALDSVAATIMGMESSDVPTNPIGRESGLGENDLSRIEIRGASLKDCINPFLFPGRELKKIPFIARKVYHLRENIIKPIVVNSKCTQCLKCMELCPVNAIEMNPLPQLNKNCINCFCCYENCPDDAIQLISPWYFRPLVRKRLAGLSLE